MTFLSDIYALPTNVPFLDVDVDNDNLLFADGSAVRNATGPYGVRAQAQLTGFFTGLIQLRQSPSLADRTRGLSILQRMREPGETRLGYSAKGYERQGIRKRTWQGTLDRAWEPPLPGTSADPDRTPSAVP